MVDELQDDADDAILSMIDVDSEIAKHTENLKRKSSQDGSGPQRKFSA